MDETFESERAIRSQENTTASNKSSNEGDDANNCDEENTSRIIGELQSAIQPIHPPCPGVFFSSDDDAATALKSLQGSHFSTASAARSTADASTSGEDDGLQLNERKCSAGTASRTDNVKEIIGYSPGKKLRQWRGSAASEWGRECSRGARCAKCNCGAASHVVTESTEFFREFYCQTPTPTPGHISRRCGSRRGNLDCL